MNPNLLIRAHMFQELCLAKGKVITFAESCTGGLVSAALTSVPGASKIYKYGWICYSAEAKHVQLGVDLDLIAREGVVSEPVALAMAEGALEKSQADSAIALTGNAGPTAEVGSAPVGTVCIALARRCGDRLSLTLDLQGLDRNQWRERVAMETFDFMLSQIQSNNS